MDIFKTQYSDEQIMLLLRNKDEEAFSILYDRYSKKIVSYFYRMLNKDIDKAEDFMHDLFLKIIEKPDAFDCNLRFKTWIYSIASNMCKNEYKKIGVRNEFKNEESYKTEFIDNFICEKIDQKLFENNLNESLEDLNNDHKTVFLLRYQQEFSIKEIAEITKSPEGTVKSRLFYTIKILSEKLKFFNPKII
jgi:RNA polymerase sigma-70 factor, ECF subfamily